MKSTPANALETTLGNRSFHLLLIAIVGLGAYLNTFNSPFVFDDGYSIVNNPVIKDLGNFTSSLTGYRFNPRRYIGYLTFALNYRFGGLSVTGYHAVNLSIHILNGVLLYCLVLLIFRTPYFRGRRSECSTPSSKKGSRQHEASNMQPSSSRVVEGPETHSIAQQLNFSLTPFTSNSSQLTIHNPRSFIALFSALLFVSHPVQTQAVTYIVQRFTSLATMFYLLSVVMYLKARITTQEAKGVAQSREAAGAYIQRSLRSVIGPLLYALCSLFFAVLAMKTKEITFTLPIMILLCEFVFFKASLRSKLFLLVPLLLTLMIIPMSMMHTGKPLGQMLSDLSEQARVQTDISREDYLMTEMRVIVTYLRLILLPVNQNLVYDYPIFHSFSRPVLLSFLLLVALFGAAVWLLHKARRAECKAPSVENSMPYAPCAMRLIAFGIFWFFIALSVESSVIPIADVIFEHRVYLPSIGAFIALTATAYAAATEAVKRWPRMGKVFIPAALIIVTVFSGATLARNTLWKDKLTLWNDVVKKSPENARAYNNRGVVLNDMGQFNKAVHDFDKAIALNPTYSLAYLNRGSAFGNMGQSDGAIDNFSKVISLQPSVSAYYFRGMVFETEGQTDKAIRDYEQAVRLNPAYLEAYIRSGVLYGKSGDLDRAIEEFTKAAAINPGYRLAYADRGFAYSLMGRYNEAIRDLTRAIELDDSDADTFMNRGAAYLRTGEEGLAMADFKTACDLGKKEACGALSSPK